MSRRPRSPWRLLLAGAVLAGGVLAAFATADRRAARGLLPDGAGLAVEVRGAGEIFERIEGTRFAAAFAAGPTHAWLERSGVVQAIDGLRAGIGRATGYTPQRRHLLALAWSEGAAAWYPGAAGTSSGGAVPWVAAGKLRLRALPIAAAARVALRFGLGGLAREEIAEATVFTLGSGRDAVHLFADGRLLVAASDRELIGRAARLAAGDGPALVETQVWKEAFAPLPQRGELRLWASGDLLPDWARLPSRAPPRAVGALLSAGPPVTVDVFYDAPDPAARRHDGTSPPALALAGPAPLFFHSSAGSVPPVLAGLIDDRAAAVARRGGSSAPARPALGRGFALAVTDADEGGLFPRPHGIVAIGMRDAEASREALRLLFPPGARSAAGRWGTALATRESLPLAGEFELWGAAAGDRLVFATRQALLEGLAAPAPAGGGGPPAAAAGDRPLDALTTINVTKLLPLLRRYAPPLSGLLRARHRGAPDVSRDLELLAAVRAVAVTTGTSPAGTLSRVTLEVGDIPAAR